MSDVFANRHRKVLNRRVKFLSKRAETHDDTALSWIIAERDALVAALAIIDRLEADTARHDPGCLTADGIAACTCLRTAANGDGR